MRWPDVRFIVSTGTSDGLIQAVRQGDLDLALAVTIDEPPIRPRHAWKRQTVWVHSEATRIDSEGPVPLVCYGEDCACQRLAVSVLQAAGRDCDFVYTTRSLVSLAAAVKAGFGVMVMPRGRALQNKLTIWEDAPLPKLPEIHCGLFVRAGATRPPHLELADYLATDLLADRQALEDRAKVTSLRPPVQR
jgi:DNA-binding transcriptional LysR family regulator